MKMGLGFSLALHVFIVAVFIIKFFYFSKPILDLSQAISVNIGELAPSEKLPEKVQPEMAPDEEVAPAPVEEETSAAPVKPKALLKKEIKVAAKEPEINLNKSKLKQKEAMNRLKKLSALDQIRQDIKKEGEKKPVVKGPAKPRIIAAGSALSGLDKLDANTYLSQVDHSIKEMWALPQWLLNKPLKAQVLVKITADGKVISTKVISSSANSSYDDYCLKAINGAAPFPKVPEKLSEKFSVDGIVVGFPE